MITRKLSAADLAAYERGLLSDHKMRVLVQVLDLDHHVQGEATGVVLSGSVDIDVEQDVMRTCTMEISDPGNRLGLDAPGISHAALYADRMLQVHYGVWSHEYPHWVDMPIFAGPIMSLRRSRHSISLTASSKEVMVNQPQSRTWRFGPGTPKTSIMRRVLADCGETHVSIPSWSDRISSPWVCWSSEAPWPKLQQLAYSLASRDHGTDPLLHYNGAGWVVLKPHSENTAWKFTRDTDMLTEPDITSDLSQVKNFIVVSGAKNKNGTVHAYASLPDSHPLSAKSLARGGVRRNLREEIQDDQITTTAQAKRIAQARLDRLGWSYVDVNFDSLVIPHLEPRDVIDIASGDWHERVQITKYTIPLTADGVMSIGRHIHTRRVTRRTPARRRR